MKKEVDLVEKWWRENPHAIVRVDYAAPATTPAEVARREKVQRGLYGGMSKIKSPTPAEQQAHIAEAEAMWNKLRHERLMARAKEAAARGAAKRRGSPLTSAMRSERSPTT
jgi:hypothetical protein